MAPTHPNGHNGQQIDRLESRHPDNDRLLRTLREQWAELRAAGENVVIAIELLTDGSPDAEEPLAYDILQKTDESLITFTVVEQPEATDQFLGLAGVTMVQAQQTMQNLLAEAMQAADLDPAELSQTRLLCRRQGALSGLSAGFHVDRIGDPHPFETNYQHWFTARLILEAAEAQNGWPFHKLVAALDDGGRFTIELA